MLSHNLDFSSCAIRASCSKSSHNSFMSTKFTSLYLVEKFNFENYLYAMVNSWQNIYVFKRFSTVEIHSHMIVLSQFINYSLFGRLQYIV